MVIMDAGLDDTAIHVRRELLNSLIVSCGAYVDFHPGVRH